MTVTGLPVVGLIWDGLDLQQSNFDLMFTITEGLDNLPDVRASDQIIPFRSGRLPSPAIADHRAVVAHGWIAGSGSIPRDSFRDYLDALKAALDPTTEPRLLVVTMADGTRRWINAIPRNLMPGDNIADQFSAFSIEWKACDPFWYGQWGLLSLDSGLLLDTGWALDSSPTLVITPTGSPYTQTFDALGTTENAKVRIEIDGPTSGAVSVRNMEYEDDHSLGFSHPALAAGETLIVDSGLRRVTLGVVNARGDLTLFANNRNGEYFRLRPGSQSVKVIGDPAEVRIVFDPCYL